MTSNPRTLARLEQIIDLVERLEEASDTARSWTQPSSCGRTDELGGMPCRHPDCIERAGRYAKEFTREAVRIVRQLQSVLRRDAEAGTPPRRCRNCGATSPSTDCDATGFACVMEPISAGPENAGTALEGPAGKPLAADPLLAATSDVPGQSDSAAGHAEPPPPDEPLAMEVIDLIRRIRRAPELGDGCDVLLEWLAARAAAPGTEPPPDEPTRHQLTDRLVEWREQQGEAAVAKALAGARQSAAPVEASPALMELLRDYDAAADKFIAKVQSGRARSVETYADLRACRAMSRDLLTRVPPTGTAPPAEAR